METAAIDRPNTPPAPRTERQGLSHEAALELRIDNLIAWLRYALLSATEDFTHQERSAELVLRAERVRILGMSFDAMLAEYCSIQGFDHEFDLPFTDAAFAFAKRMSDAAYARESAL